MRNKEEYPALQWGDGLVLSATQALPITVSLDHEALS